MFINMVNNFISYCNTVVYLVFTIWEAKFEKFIFLYLKTHYWHKAIHINVSVPGLYY